MAANNRYGCRDDWHLEILENPDGTVHARFFHNFQRNATPITQCGTPEDVIDTLELYKQLDSDDAELVETWKNFIAILTPFVSNERWKNENG